MCADASCGDTGANEYCCQVSAGLCGRGGLRECNTPPPKIPFDFCTPSPPPPPQPAPPPAPPTPPPAPLPAGPASSQRQQAERRIGLDVGVSCAAVALLLAIFCWVYRRRRSEDQVQLVKEFEMKGNNLALGGFANVALEKEKLAAAIVKLKAENTDHPGRLPYYGSDGARLTSEVRMLRVGKPDIAAGGLGLFLNLPDTFRVPLAHEPGDGLFSEAVKAIEHEFEQSDRVYPSGATDRLLLKYILYGRTGAPDEIMVRRNDGTSEGPLSLVPNYWLRWECLGTRKPDTWKRSGDKLSKTTSVQAVMLSNALESKYAALRSEPPAAESQPPRANTVVIFTEEEWEQIGLAGLRRSHYIKSGGKYFQPSDPGRFPNGSIDEGHAPGLSLDDFYNHENSKNARLTKAHVLAPRTRASTTRSGRRARMRARRGDGGSRSRIRSP